jgi:transcriptional regulator with XRE-family HTH domain
MATTTLGGFIAEQMRRQQMNNSNLAEAAGISEGAVRNLLKHGLDRSAKDPDARTLRRVAEALDLNPLYLYRLAGYLPPEPDAKSVRAEFVGDVFDRLTTEKQVAVLGVLEVMASDVQVSKTVQAIRDDTNNPLAGFDTVLSPRLLRMMANTLIADYQMSEPTDIDRIAPDKQLLNYRWDALPQGTQERIKALIRRKISLDYDPTMVDPEWRE